MNKMRWRIGAAGILLLTVGATAATAKPEVAVRFVLAQEDYRDELEDPEIVELEQEVTKFLIGKLGQEVGFLQFSRSATADYTVIFRLGDPQATGPLREVGFHVELTGPGISDADDYLPFLSSEARGTAEEDFLATKELFVARIQAELGKTSFEELVPPVFSAVPVAGADSHLIKQSTTEEPVAWVIPYRREELCMDLGSQIKVAALVPTEAFGDRPREYRAVAKQTYNPTGPLALEELRHRLVCVPSRDQEDFHLLRDSDPNDVKVSEIFVLVYHRIDEACQVLIPPGEAFPSGGGS